MANMAMCYYQMVVHQCTDFAAVRLYVWDGDLECLGGWELRGQTVATGEVCHMRVAKVGATKIFKQLELLLENWTLGVDSNPFWEHIFVALKGFHFGIIALGTVFFWEALCLSTAFQVAT